MPFVAIPSARLEAEDLTIPPFFIPKASPKDLPDEVAKPPKGIGSSEPDMKKGGAVKTKKMASGGKVSQLAKANGIAVRGKTRGKIC